MHFSRLLILSVIFQSVIACSNNQEDYQKEAQLTQHLNIVKNNDSKPNHKVYLSQYFDSHKTLPQNNFSCDDKVFAVMEFNNYPAKLHQIQIEWKDPFDQVREKNDFKYFITGAQAFAWSSLKLHRGTGAGLLQWINPAAGMEEFIGEWTVDVRVGDIIQETVKFEVLC